MTRKTPKTDDLARIAEPPTPTTSSGPPRSPAAVRSTGSPCGGGGTVPTRTGDRVLPRPHVVDRRSTSSGRGRCSAPATPSASHPADEEPLVTTDGRTRRLELDRLYVGRRDADGSGVVAYQDPGGEWCQLVADTRRRVRLGTRERRRRRPHPHPLRRHRPCPADRRRRDDPPDGIPPRARRRHSPPTAGSSPAARSAAMWEPGREPVQLLHAGPPPHRNRHVCPVPERAPLHRPPRSPPGDVPAEARRHAAARKRLEDDYGIVTITSLPPDNALWICDVCNTRIHVSGEVHLIPLIGSYALCFACVIPLPLLARRLDPTHPPSLPMRSLPTAPAAPSLALT